MYEFDVVVVSYLKCVYIFLYCIVNQCRQYLAQQDLQPQFALTRSSLNRLSGHCQAFTQKGALCPTNETHFETTSCRTLLLYIH